MVVATASSRLCVCTDPAGNVIKCVCVCVRRCVFSQLAARKKAGLYKGAYVPIVGGCPSWGTRVEPPPTFFTTVRLCACVYACRTPLLLSLDLLCVGGVRL